MSNIEPTGTSIWKQLASLLHLWPAALTVILVTATLPITRPVLAELPERLSMEIPVEEPETSEQPDEEEFEEEPLAAVLDANYEDGVYTGSAQGFGGLITVQVTVEDGQITAIDILSADGETTSFFNRAMGVIEAVLTQQTWDVDVISGATYSSRGILGAIQNALTGVQAEAEEPAQEITAVNLSSDTFQEPAGGYRDGTYYGSASGFGGQIRVKVVISGGKISSVSIVSAPGETSSYLNKAKAVIQRMIAADSPNVDTVSGATYSSNGIINAVKRALAQASNSGDSDLAVVEELKTVPSSDSTPLPNQSVTAPSGTYKDGVYVGTGEGFGGDIKVQVTIKDGKITNVKILSAEDETPAYLNRASALLSQITASQSTEIDVISGATYSSNGILDATRSALSQAAVEEESTPAKPSTSEEENKDSPSTEPVEQPEEPKEEALYADGSYTATALCTDDDLFCYQVQVTITVTDGKIADVAVEKLQDTSDDPELNEAYLNYAINGRTRKDVWYEGVVNQILAEQSAEEIDIVSSATYSSNAITMAAQEALQGAKVEMPQPDEENPREELPGEAEDGEEIPSEEDPGEESPGEEDLGEENPGEETPGEENPEDTPGETNEDESDCLQNEPVYQDGSYTATALCTDDDLFCYQVQVSVTVTDGKIMGVAVEKLEDTSDDPEANETYLGYAVNGRTRKDVWYEGVVNQILTKQSAEEIDVVSSATYSSNAITLAAQKALQDAKVEAEA